MNAGRELDALVAEKVMGATWKHFRNGLSPDGWTRFLTADPEDDRYEDARGDEADVMGPKVPYYSTDISAAWTVVEKIGMSVVRSDDGWYAVKPEDIQHGILRGTAYPTITLVWPELGKYPEPDDTAPLAICLAALAAVGARVPA